MGKIINFEELEQVRSWHPNQEIVHCHGVFDLLHHGHLAHLKSAKKMGECLVVSITPDKFVNKGPHRPHYTAIKRAEMLAALDVVDYVAVNITPSAIEPILSLKPNYYIKGPDYKNLESDMTGGILREKQAVETVGGKLVFTQDETDSSTKILNQHFSQWTPEQQRVVDQLKSVCSLSDIINEIDALSKLKILVIGEPIIDTYVFCEPQGISSKSPSISARFLYEENYTGGTLAIANHLAALGCQTTLISPHGNESYYREAVEQSLDPAIDLIDIHLVGYPTPKKTRFIVPFRSQRIFEVTNVAENYWVNRDSSEFCAAIEKAAEKVDLIIIADFGHGIFENSVLNFMSDLKKFKALNVQTNSSNFGFNPFTKHRNFQYLSIDERECRVANHDRLTQIDKLVHDTVRDKSRCRTAVTRGTQGSVYFDDKFNAFSCPVFSSEPVDTTGAGDAFFAITSLLVKNNVNPLLVPFIGNCYAGLKTQIIGNKTAVKKNDLIRTVESILK